MRDDNSLAESKFIEFKVFSVLGGGVVVVAFAIQTIIQPHPSFPLFPISFACWVLDLCCLRDLSPHSSSARCELFALLLA